ncbi:MAG: hypothetical protein QNJ19_13875 [Woeseiaceae bacterium]|nr:hypothetical protein [Woeseiaceae bacterium]
MTLWIVFIVMALAAAAFVVRPMVRPGAMYLGIAAGVFVVAASFLLYRDIGSPELKSHTPNVVPDVTEVVEALAARLESEPGDIDGWKMLGRSYLALGEYQPAADAFEQAVTLEEGKVAQTLVDLGESRLAASGQSLTSDIVQLFENALALEPGNARALFWGGIASANRRDLAEAADRWEKLLATGPPPEVRQLIEQRVAEWRGVEAPPAASTPTPVASAPAEVAPESGLSLTVDMPAQTKQSLPPNTVVFIIARDPAQPAPPIAVQRRQLSELPTTVVMTDADAMIPGRGISTLESIEVIARASLTGQPAASSGDWFGTAQAAPGSSLSVTLDQRVP